MHVLEINIGAAVDRFHDEVDHLNVDATGLLVALKYAAQLVPRDILDGRGERSYSFQVFAHSRHLATVTCTLGDAEPLDDKVYAHVFRAVARLREAIAADTGYVVLPHTPPDLA